jgi:hypothetical protein
MANSESTSNKTPIVMRAFNVAENKGLVDYSLNRFYDVAKRDGFARGYLFRITNISNVPLGDSLIYATAGKIPDRKINTATVNHRSYTFRVPMNAEFPDSQGWSVKFYSDSKNHIRNILEDWSNSYYSVTNFTSNTNINYHDLEMVLLSVTENGLEPVATYRLIGCYPTLISNSSYSTTNSGEIVTVTATLAFQYVAITYNAANAKEESLIDKINNITKKIKGVTSTIKQVTGTVSNVSQAVRNLKNIRR